MGQICPTMTIYPSNELTAMPSLLRKAAKMIRNTPKETSPTPSHIVSDTLPIPIPISREPADEMVNFELSFISSYIIR